GWRVPPRARTRPSVTSVPWWSRPDVRCVNAPRSTARCRRNASGPQRRVMASHRASCVRTCRWYRARTFPDRKVCAEYDEQSCHHQCSGGGRGQGAARGGIRTGRFRLGVLHRIGREGTGLGSCPRSPRRDEIAGRNGFIDGHVAVLAGDLNATVFTSDPDNITKLDPTLTVVHV